MLPLEVTVAIAVDDDDQVTAPTEISALFWSRPAAVAVDVSPTRIDGALIETITEARTAVLVGGSLPPPQDADARMRLAMATTRTFLML